MCYINITGSMASPLLLCPHLLLQAEIEFKSYRFQLKLHEMHLLLLAGFEISALFIWQALIVCVNYICPFILPWHLRKKKAKPCKTLHAWASDMVWLWVAMWEISDSSIIAEVFLSLRRDQRAFQTLEGINPNLPGPVLSIWIYPVLLYPSKLTLSCFSSTNSPRYLFYYLHCLYDSQMTLMLTFHFTFFLFTSFQFPNDLLLCSSFLQELERAISIASSRLSIPLSACKVQPWDKPEGDKELSPKKAICGYFPAFFFRL